MLASTGCRLVKLHWMFHWMFPPGNAHSSLSKRSFSPAAFPVPTTLTKYLRGSPRPCGGMRDLLDLCSRGAPYVIIWPATFFGVFLARFQRRKRSVFIGFDCFTLPTNKIFDVWWKRSRSFKILYGRTYWKGIFLRVRTTYSCWQPYCIHVLHVESLRCT